MLPKGTEWNSYSDAVKGLYRNLLLAMLMMNTLTEGPLLATAGLWPAVWPIIRSRFVTCWNKLTSEFLMLFYQNKQVTDHNHMVK